MIAAPPRLGVFRLGIKKALRFSRVSAYVAESNMIVQIGRVSSLGPGHDGCEEAVP